MDTPQQKPKLIKKNIGRSLKWLIGTLPALLIIGLAALQLPYVQNRLFTRFLRHLSHTTSLTITHRQFQLRWLSKASITGLNIQGTQGHRILDAEHVALTINPWQQLKLLLGTSAQRGTNLQMQADRLTVNVRHLTGKPLQQALKVEVLSTSLHLAPGRVVCQALNLRTQQSAIQGDCTVTYDASALPANLYESAQITADISESTIASEDLGLFIPYFGLHKTHYRFSGTIEGKLDELHLKNFRFDLAGQDNYLQGNLSLQGLPNLPETVFNIELQQGCLQTQDLLSYLDPQYHYLLSGLSYVRPQGHIYGKHDNFTACATFSTALGHVRTDLKIQLNAASHLATYKGALATDGFELGKWLNNQAAVQRLTMQGQIDGRGLSRDTAHFQLEATIDKLGWNNYEYQNTDIRGAFSQTSFEGKITVNDPNLQCKADAVIDVSKDQERMAIQGAIAHADLQALRLTAVPLTFNTELSMNLQGFSLDNSQMDAQLNGLYLGLADKQVQLGTLHLRTDQNDRGRSLALDSSLVAFHAEGDFAYTALANDFKQFFQSFQHRLSYTTPIPSKQTVSAYTLVYQVHCKDINPLLRIFKPDIYVAPGARLEGSFAQNRSTTFSLKLAEAPSLAFKQYRSKGTQLTIQAERTQETAVSATIQLCTQEQQWGTFTTKEDFTLDVSWVDNRINFGTTLGQAGTLHQLRIKGAATLLGTTIALTFDPMSIQLFDQAWHIHPENLITFGKNWTEFKNFEWVSETQQVSVNGILVADPNRVLHIKVKNFALDNLNSLVSKPLTGVLNATAVLRGVLGQSHIDSEISAEQFAIDNYLIGDLHAKTNWEDTLKRLSLEGQLAYSGQQTVAVQGFYEPEKGENSLQLVAHLSQAQLSMLEPLANEVFSQLTGELTGRLSIGGSPTSPRITGAASMSNATVKIDYLQAFYRAQGELTFDNQVINVNKLSLTDDRQGRAELRGLLTYKDFKELYLDLQGEMTRLKLLSTASEDNEYFYGVGTLSGSLALSGPVSQMAVNINAKTDVGTNIYIPAGGTINTATHAEFIRFVNNKREQQSSQARQVDLEGLKLTMLLEVTPDAVTEIILNNEGGDVIKGRGEGRLKIVVDTEGYLSVAGGFEFSEGEYSFSLYQIVDNTFKILPQSKITWTDSPYEGVLDVKAVYEQRVTLTSLLQDTQEVDREKYPVQIVVKLQGALLSPKMDFQINFLEYPGSRAAQTAISSFQQRIEDRLYLEQQVMSLIIFNRFSESGLATAGRGVFSRRLSELIARQLDNLVASLDEKLEFETDVDLEKLGDKGLEGVRFKLSRSFLDGRLRVSREGGLGTDGTEETGASQLLGNWAVEYLLTQDGRLKAKFYNKQSTGKTHTGAARPFTTTSGGVSLLYTRNFDHFPDLNLKQWWRGLFGARHKDEERVTKKETPQK